MRKHIEINSDLCNGCRICMMVCSSQKSGKFNQFNTGIRVHSDLENGLDIPSVCRQCKNPVCVKVCPAEKAWVGQKALFHPPIFRDPTTGTVQLDSTKESCLGCKECMHACPFGCIGIVPEDLQLVKCDLCKGDPECVKFCPTGAIKYVEVARVRDRKTP